MSAVNVSIHLIDGSLHEYETGQDLLVDLAAFQAKGFVGKQLIHALFSNDWGPPPVFIDITGRDNAGAHVEVRIPYRQ